MQKRLIVLFIFIFLKSTAQHTISYSSYMLSPVLVNPAFAGADGALSTGLVSRVQFLGTESGNPLSNTLFAHSPLINKNIAIGTIMSYDKFGPQHNFNGNFIASVKFKIQKIKVSLAGTVGYTNNRLVFDNPNNSISNEEANADPVLRNNNLNKFNFGLGLNLQYKFFFLGANIPTLRVVSNATESPLQKEYFYNQIQVYGGVNYRLSDNVILKPSFLLRNLKGSGFQPDINFLVSLFDRYTAGVSYKLNNAISGLIMINITPQFGVSYCYDYITSNLNINSRGNHELQLKYIFKYYVNDMNVKRFK
ncbi:MAG: type IX secretion system membrane protein PorP/SprF [Bacteroidetes bacterium]|nr:MAG: type IX secretion system membrane protein PorP/SprF [Bacteroidota bacterium]